MAMELKNSLFQICIIITISLFVFNLCVHYVSGMGVFPTGATGGFEPGDDSNETLQRSTVGPDYPGGITMTSMWGFVLTAAGAVGLLVAWLTHSTSVLGVFIFSVAFWASYINTIGIINIGNYIPSGFILIGTAAMGLIWIGAVAGMLSGSG